MSTIDLKSLNERQREAVTAPDESVLVLAGAGSGKTRVLTTRIAYLLEHGVKPHQIIAMTFTNKAAKEMEERLEKMVEADVRSIWVGTFHGLCNRLLRYHAKEAGLKPDFQIMDSADQLSMVKRLMKQANIDMERYDARQFQNYINWHKEHFIRAARASREGLHALGAEIYAAYETQCQQESMVDFAELLLRTYELLNVNSTIRHHYQARFKHILVDEFQDTNVLQYRLILLLAGWGGKPGVPKNSVFAVGDDDQSIYAFRGANVGNMSDFLRDFEIKDPIRLEENYRSTGAILDCANELISHNKARLGKNLWTRKAGGNPVIIQEHAEDRDEVKWVINEIKRHYQETGSYRDQAILYRTNAQSRLFEQALMTQGIPFKIYGGMRFFDRAEIKHLLAYMRLVNNPHDDTSFLRVVNFPTRGIGAKSVETLSQFAQTAGTSLWGAMTDSSHEVPARLFAFTDLLDKLRQMARTMTMVEWIKQVIDLSGLRAYYEKEQGGEDKIENLMETISAAQGVLELEHPEFLDVPALKVDPESEMTPLSLFLSHVTLDGGTDGSEKDANLDQVQMMTVHASKGLEFPIVYLVGVEEGIFPHSSSMKQEPNKPKTGGIDEERRLMYVAMTRAQKELFISHARVRNLYGNVQSQAESSFLENLPAHAVRRIECKKAKTSFGTSRGGRRGWNEDDDASWEERRQSFKKDSDGRAGFKRYGDDTQPGLSQKDKEFSQKTRGQRAAEFCYKTFGLKLRDRVKHTRNGYGYVIGMSGEELDDAIVQVQFDTVGVRSLLMSIAKDYLIKVEE